MMKREDWPDGHLANCFVSKLTPAYERIAKLIDSGNVPMASRSSYGSALMRECVREVQGGVWVPLSWLR